MSPLLDLELLRTFSTVVKVGELKRAAECLFRSQAAVSMQLKRLEEQLGVRLLERNNQGIRLTEAGERLLGYAEQLLRLNQATLNAINRRELSGQVSFGVPVDYAQDFLRRLMPVLLQAFPQLSPRVICDRSRQLRELVRLGELDIAIASGELELSNEEVLWSERLIWVSAPGVVPQELERLPVAMFDGDCIVRDLALADLKQADRQYQQVFSSPVMDNLVAAVEAGLAVSLLPESVLEGRQLRAFELPQASRNRMLNVNLISSPALEEVTREPLLECMRRSARTLAGRIQ